MSQTEHNDLTVLREKYLLWMKVQNYSAATVKMRGFYLKKFIEWCKERSIESAEEVTKQLFERYKLRVFLHRKADGRALSNSAQISQLIPLRTFFCWLARNNYILYDPASGLELPRKERHLPRHVLSVSEVEQILSEPDIETPNGLRDRTILEVLYSTGIRRSEAAALRLSDIDAGRGALMVRQGKGKKDRFVPIGDRALSWIEKYITEARLLWYADLNDGPLFLTVNGNPLQPGYVTAIVRSYIRATELSKTGSCHLFRHSMATMMLENGADIRYIQEMLGHAYLSSTQVYTHVSIQKLKEVHQKTHPAKLIREHTVSSDEEE